MAEAAAASLRLQVANLVEFARASKGRKLRAALESSTIDSSELVNARSDPGGWTCLHTAAYQGNTRMVRLLLEYGARVTVRSHAGYTAVDYAHRKGHVDVEDILISALKDEVKAENSRRRSAALAASSSRTPPPPSSSSPSSSSKTVSFG